MIAQTSISSGTDVTADEPHEVAVRAQCDTIRSQGEVWQGRRYGFELAARRMPSWLRPDLIATVAVSFGTFGITAIQGIILARMLGPEGRGEFGTAIFYSTTLTFVGMLGAQYAIARRAARNPDERVQLSRSALQLAVFTGLITLVVVAILGFTTLPADKQFLAPLCVVAGLALPFEHMRQFLLAVDQGTAEFRRFNAVTLLTSAVFPLLLLVLWASGYVSVTAAVVLSLAGPIIGLIFRLSLVKPQAKSIRSEQLPPRTLVKEGAPYLFSSAVCDLYHRLDQFLVLWLGSLFAQGLYAAAVPAASLLQVGATALALFSFNSGSRQNVHMSPRQLFNAGLVLALFQLLTGVIFALVVGRLIVLFYGERFAAAVPFALALIPAHAVNGFAQVVEGHLRGRGIVRAGIWARIAAAAMMVAITLALFGRLETLAIPVAATIANTLVAAILTWVTLTAASGEGNESLVAETQEAVV